MNRRSDLIRLGALCAAASLTFLGAVSTGCSKKDGAVSKQEQDNWKGGPMPASFAQEMERKSREAQQKAQQEGPQQQVPR